MPISYAQTRPTLRQEILDRVSQGERLKAVCAGAWMPCVESVTGWARQDAVFAEALRVAYLQGDSRRRLAMDETVAKALVSRLAAGERLADVLADPAMPSRKVFAYWRAVYGWFAEALYEQMQIKARTRRDQLKARYRPYDPVIGERLYVQVWKGGRRLRAILASDPTFPSLMVLARWRSENRQFGAMMAYVLGNWRTKRARDRSLCTPEMMETITEALLQGHSLRSISREADMPSQGAM